MNSTNEHRSDKSLRRQVTVRFLEIVSILVDTYDDQIKVVAGLSQ